MLDLKTIASLVHDAVASTFNAVTFSRVSVEPTVDSEGMDALSVLVVLNENGTADVDGDLALDTLVSIDRMLQAHGDNRLAIVSFSTEAELEDAEL